jgi:tRNA (guanosine-2'-O-)-methyltransferase
VFPFTVNIEIPNSRKSDGKVARLPAQTIHDRIASLLTPDRLKKISEVVEQRTFSVSVVLENIHDRGNASAVMRSAEALGLAQVHSIEPGEKLKESQRTTAGADKWVELSRWKTTQECISQLKKEKKQIIVTHLDSTSKPIHQVDFTKPTAIVLGNEKDGASQEMIAAADVRVILPMVGFVQSYNISVAGALCFYHIYMDRMRRQSFHGDLTPEQKMILRTHYYLRTQNSAFDVLNELIVRGELKAL